MAEEKEKAKKPCACDVVFKHIEASKEPVKVKGLKNILKLTAGQVAGSIRRLEQEKKIKKTERGVYQIN